MKCDIDHKTLLCRRCRCRVSSPYVLRNCGTPAHGLGDMAAAGLTAVGITTEQVAVIVGGPGYELKRLLSRLGMASDAGCGCDQRAAQMDAWGCDECEKRLDEIVGWLEEEHRKRSAARETILPWSKLLATNIVKLAIRRARRKESTGPN